MSNTTDFIIFLQEHYPDYEEQGVPEEAYAEYKKTIGEEKCS